MIDLLRHLIPDWPASFTAWDHFVALAIVGLVKVFRGRTMQNRARRIDFFGWSIIGFDYVFGGALLIGTLWALYPNLHNEWLDVLVTNVLLVVALIQAYTVKTVPHHRIDRAISRPQIEPQDDPSFVERRSGPPGRRATDITAYSCWNEQG